MSTITKYRSMNCIRVAGSKSTLVSDVTMSLVTCYLDYIIIEVFVMCSHISESFKCFRNFYIVLMDYILLYIAAIRNNWKEISDKTATAHTWTGLTLKEGARYSVRVGAINNAGYLASFETNGVVIDTSPPIVSVTMQEYKKKLKTFYCWLNLRPNTKK